MPVDSFEEGMFFEFIEAAGTAPKSVFRVLLGQALDDIYSVLTEVREHFDFGGQFIVANLLSCCSVRLFERMLACAEHLVDDET